METQVNLLNEARGRGGDFENLAKIIGASPGVKGTKITDMHEKSSMKIHGAGASSGMIYRLSLSPLRGRRIFAPTGGLI